MSADQISSCPLPVTMVCGFMGAGKNTVIRELLAERGTERWALLVHDRSELAWAASEETGSAVELFQLEETLAELMRSCVGCSFCQAVTDAILSIAGMRRLDRLIVECSGLVESTMVASIFNDAIADEESLAGLAQLQQLVTVVDAATVWEGIRSADALRERGVSGGEDDTRVLSELLVEQIEHCSLIALNRSAAIDVDCRERVITLLRYLNPEAEILLAEDRVRRAERILADRDGAEYGISFQPGWAKLIDQAGVPCEPSQEWSTGCSARAVRFIRNACGAVLKKTGPASCVARGISGWHRSRSAVSPGSRLPAAGISNGWGSGGWRRRSLSGRRTRRFYAAWSRSGRSSSEIDVRNWGVSGMRRIKKRCSPG